MNAYGAAAEELQIKGYCVLGGLLPRGAMFATGWAVLLTPKLALQLQSSLQPQLRRLLRQRSAHEKRHMSTILVTYLALRECQVQCAPWLAGPIVAGAVQRQ